MPTPGVLAARVIAAGRAAVRPRRAGRAMTVVVSRRLQVPTTVRAGPPLVTASSVQQLLGFIAVPVRVGMLVRRPSGSAGVPVLLAASAPGVPRVFRLVASGFHHPVVS
ncbi:MAG: hypothetical protein ACTHPS_31185 [Streptosporangiaceae bacterium]